MTTAAAGPEPQQGPAWIFPINVMLALAVLMLATAFASVTNLRAAQAAQASRAPGPTRPLTISSVSVVQGGIASDRVYTAATSNSLVASFVGSQDWRPAPRQCLPDVTGIVRATGGEWLSQTNIHLASIAGDLGSGDLYATGLGEYCAPVARRSVDGGTTWTEATLPAGLSGDPAWLHFDPTRPGTLLALGGERLFTSVDSGLTWSEGTADVQPLAFGSSGLLHGWSPGSLYASSDDGATWQLVGGGPTEAPSSAATADGGLLLAEPDGLWWYPDGGSPTLIPSGPVLALAPAGDGVVVTGVDTVGQPWLGAFAVEGVAGPTLRLTRLPAHLDVAGLATARAAANDSGALVAVGGTTSAILFVGFAR